VIPFIESKEWIETKNELYKMMEVYTERMNRQREQEALLAAQREQELREKKPEVKNIIEQATKRKIRITESLQNFTIIHKMSSISNTPQISLVIANTPDLPTEEHEDSLIIGNEHLSTILETESNEVIKSSVKNLVPIPSESEVTSDNKSECDVPVNDESSPIFTTFSNHLFDCNDDFTSSDDKSLSNEDVPMENFKIYSNPLFDGDGIISTKIDPHYFNVESNFLESLLNRDTLIDSSPKIDYLLEEFSSELAHIDPIPLGIKETEFDLEEGIRLVENLLYDNSSPRPPEELNAEIADTILESLSSSPIPVEDSDSHMEEIDLFLATDDLMPPGIENDDYVLEGDIHFLEELLSNDPLPLPENESSNFDHHHDPSFPRPPPEPLDVEAAQREQELLAQKQAAQEKEEPPQNFDFRQLIGEMYGIKASAEQKQKLKEMMLELFELCREKEIYCVHDSIEDLIGMAMNTTLLSINLKSQCLDKKKHEVKNIVQQATKRKTRITESLQNFTIIHTMSSISNMPQISLVIANTPDLLFSVIHQPPQEMSIQEIEDLKQQYLNEMKRLINLEYRNEIKIDELKENFNSMSIEINKKEKLQQLEQVSNLSTYPSKHFNSFCYDDDDDEDYTIAVIPSLSTEEPHNSLSMGDEHLDTIPATESDEFIKSSVENLIPILIIPSLSTEEPHNSLNQFEDFSDSNDEFSSTDDDSFSIDNIDYVEASPPDSELVSSEVMEVVIPEVGGINDDILLTIKDDILREKLLNIDLLIANIEALNDNPTSSSDFITKSSSTSLNSLLEETNVIIP
nr:hypothetical protein [Tanacetum cinerariifolium]